ncbi:hypothetical protein HGRIS_011913 [Hohenbuehelia grisea]|uniref:DUF6699 domain-containing protein n=1 Tax=Hohenbuehelia grisea TaxID=104357 RepID=A0ABR3JWQ4_9AGAR
MHDLHNVAAPSLHRCPLCTKRARPSPLTTMPSYWRNPFKAQPSASGEPKSHQRSQSTPQPIEVGYIYAAPSSTPSTASSTSTSLGSRKRSNSYMGSRTAIPSPLRYPTYDSGTFSAKSQTTAQQIQPSRLPMYRRSSYKSGDRDAPYPVYTPSMSFSSSRSGSSSSIYPGSASSHRSTAPPRTSSSGSVRAAEPRPILKQNHTWHGPGHSSHAHVSFKGVPSKASAPRAACQIHPLLAHSRLHSAAISYDITFTPSTRTVLDRGTHAAVPAGTLSQPATQPPTTSRLVLQSDKLPWPVIVSPSHVSTSAQNPKTAPRFYIAGGTTYPKPKTEAAKPVTNLDVLYALHTTLYTRITQEEWEQLGHGSRSQRKITRAYEKRCIKMGGGWDEGVRRIDWLHGKTRLVGIELDKSGEVLGKLVFAKA